MNKIVPLLLLVGALAVAASLWGWKPIGGLVALAALLAVTEGGARNGL